ncbi:invasion associated locus B family protein [Pseudorhodobacter ferrugineus]|uniref:invasion associated locus B family protein n=1 Tax=Pseudorhodobacter ferrugineus TaxID=77008 RepID=UPI0004171838|nr:invasion associated locus B family protein [Pseudorhodobacter ferrugineus]
MPVTKSAQLLATTLCLLLGTTAFAQDTTTAPAADAATDAPAADAPAPDSPVPNALSMGTEAAAADGVGSLYTAASFDKWEQRCFRTEDGADPCELFQLLKDGDENPVATISLFGLPAGGQAVTGATIIVPLETLLTAELTMTVDGSKARKYPFSWCEPMGCVARVGFTQAELDGFKKGNEAKLSIVPLIAPEKRVELTLSLKGFTAGYDAVNAANGN